MEISGNNVIPPAELDYHVKSVRKYRVSDIGRSSWFDQHEILVKIHQQAALEAREKREEFVKDGLIVEGKIKILVHNAYCLLVWKHKVLPDLLGRDLNPQSSFIFYTILFHEATIVAILETLLYHGEACEALEECSLDLIDYCLQGIIQMISLSEEDEDLPQNDGIGEEIEKHKKSFVFRIGIRCLTILSFLADNLEKISLSASNRLMEIHDTPCVLSEILHKRPWLRRRESGFEKFIEDEWQPVAGDEISRVTKAEAHTWFCLRELLLNPVTFTKYEVKNFRQREISKCQGLLHDVLLDQLPPLVDLKSFLVALSVSGDSNSGRAKEKKLLLEEIPQIREELMAEIEGEGSAGIAEKIYRNLCSDNCPDLKGIASKLTKTYNLDVLEAFLPKKSRNIDSFCAVCTQPASKKCSKCLTTHYCSRDCQVKHWKIHKSSCKK
ncbi:Zinc finger MYND domain-containing protein 10 [Sergentomyia squamirostris]